MEALIIKKTESTPYITLDKANNRFEIGGNSLPEDARGYYEPVNAWLKEYAKNPNDRTELVFRLDYMNTASSKMVFELIKTINGIKLDGKNAVINWGHLDGDDDGLESGTDMATMFDVPFIYTVYY